MKLQTLIVCFADGVVKGHKMMVAGAISYTNGYGVLRPICVVVGGNCRRQFARVH